MKTTNENDVLRNTHNDETINDITDSLCDDIDAIDEHERFVRQYERQTIIIRNLSIALITINIVLMSLIVYQLN